MSLNFWPNSTNNCSNISSDDDKEDYSISKRSKL